MPVPQAQPKTKLIILMKLKAENENATYLQARVEKNQRNGAWGSKLNATSWFMARETDTIMMGHQGRRQGAIHR